MRGYAWVVAVGFTSGIKHVTLPLPAEKEAVLAGKLCANWVEGWSTKLSKQ